MMNKIYLIEAEGTNKRLIMEKIETEMKQLIETKLINFCIVRVPYSKFLAMDITNELVLIEPSIQIYERIRIKNETVFVIDSTSYILGNYKNILKQALELYKKRNSKIQMNLEVII